MFKSEPLMIIALSAIMLIVSGVSSYLVSHVRFNAALVTVGAWLLVMLLATMPSVLDPPLVPETEQVFFWVGLCALGFPVGWLLSPSATEVTTTWISRTALARTHAVLVILLILGTVLNIIQIYPVIQQLGGIQALWAGGGGGADFRLNILQQRQADVTNGTNLLIGTLGYVSAPGLMSFVTSALLWKDRRLLPALVPLLVVAVRAVVIVERTTFMMGALLFVMTLGILHVAPIKYTGQQRRAANGGTRPRRMVMLFAFVLIFVAAATAYFLPLLARNAGTNRTTGIDSLAQYLLSSIAGLNIHMINGTAYLPTADTNFNVGAYPGFGAYTFYGFFDLLRRAGLPLPYAPNPQVLSYDDVFIFGNAFTTNTRTMIRDLHMDFGAFGGYFVLFLLFLLCGLMGRAIKQGNIRFVGLYGLLASALVWSFFVGVLLADFRYVFAALCSYWFLSRLSQGNQRRGTTSLSSLPEESGDPSSGPE